MLIDTILNALSFEVPNRHRELMYLFLISSGLNTYFLAYFHADSQQVQNRKAIHGTVGN